MPNRRFAMVALTAVLTVSFSLDADAAMMRAYWAGTVTDAIEGNAFGLAVGDVIFAEATLDASDLSILTSMSELIATQDVQARVTFYPEHPGLRAGTPALFSRQIHYLDGVTWEAMDANQRAVAGTWSLDSIKFNADAPQVVPIPAGLPLLLGAIGCLIGFRRKH